jgi:transcription antitermination factor NusG
VRAAAVDARSAIMSSRCKVGDDIIVTGGVHANETGEVKKVKKKRCYFYSKLLRHVVWCSLRFM